MTSITWGATDFAPRVLRGSHRALTRFRSGLSRYGHVVCTIWRIVSFGTVTLSPFTSWASLSFCPKTIRTPEPCSLRESESHGASEGRFSEEKPSAPNWRGEQSHGKRAS